MNELTDPEILREREDVEFIDTPPEEHRHHFEMYESIAGVVVAGVMDEDGRLLLMEHEQEEFPHLQFTEVEGDEDWVTAAREIIETATGIEATIERPVRVRHHTYRSEEGEETTGYDVVFAASPTGNIEIDPEAGHDWTASWHDTATLDLPDDEGNDVLNDIRLFMK